MNDGDTAVIEVVGLRKRYADVQAISGIDFTVTRGELFGFLGPNGAGKTTTIGILTGLVRPDAGTVRVAGIDCSRRPKAAQHLMGVVPDESNLYPELTGFENLCFCGALYGMKRRERESRTRELIDRFGLTAAAERKFGGYSKGMKRKLTIAAGIIHSPPILFLDEPTTGIDVASARDLRQLIADLNGGGTTIFLTTHYIEEAERLCGRIAFIVEGCIVETDTVEDLRRQYGNIHVVQFSVSERAAALCDAITSGTEGFRCSAVSDRSVRVESSSPIRIGPLVRFIEEKQVEVFEARKIRPSLEDVFVRITGIEAAEMKREKTKSGDTL